MGTTCLNFVSRTLCIEATLYRGHFVSRTLCIEETLHRGNFESRTLCIEDTLYRGHFGSTTLCIEETLYRGHFVKTPIKQTILHVKFGLWSYQWGEKGVRTVFINEEAAEATAAIVIPCGALLPQSELTSIQHTAYSPCALYTVSGQVKCPTKLFKKLTAVGFSIDKRVRIPSSCQILYICT